MGKSKRQPAWNFQYLLHQARTTLSQSGTQLGQARVPVIVIKCTYPWSRAGHTTLWWIGEMEAMTRSRAGINLRLPTLMLLRECILLRSRERSWVGALIGGEID